MNEHVQCTDVLPRQGGLFDIEYRHVQHFNEDIATHLETIVKLPESAKLKSADWPNSANQACTPSCGLGFLMFDPLLRTGECITILDSRDPVCTPVGQVTADGNTTMQVCTKAFVSTLNYGPLQYVPKPTLSDVGLPESEIELVTSRRRLVDFIEAKQADFSVPNTFAARMSKTLVCTTVEDEHSKQSTTCHVSKEAVCVKCPYVSQNTEVTASTHRRRSRTYWEHCADTTVSTSGCDEGTGEWRKFATVLQAL